MSSGVSRSAPITAKHVHGETGLDGPSLPEPAARPQPTHGVDFIVGALRVHEPGEVTLVTLGPLTNIALALSKAPDIASRIKEIVMMGGAYFEVGNITPTAEFNVYVDPEAADVVLRSGVPITLLPLDVTHRMRSTPAMNPDWPGRLTTGPVASFPETGWPGLAFSRSCSLSTTGTALQASVASRLHPWPSQRSPELKSWR